MPKFSIVVPAYNAEATLAETLDAIQTQSFTDWECVVVDDGSTDGTLAQIHLYEQADPRFRAITQENRGSGGAYNTGVSAAIGDWITICSADDILLKTHLSTMASIIDDYPGYDIYTSNGYSWRGDGSRNIVYPPLEGARVRSWTLEETFMQCFFSVGATYRRNLFHEMEGYREDVFGEDYDFWIRSMARGAKHLYMSDALALHRVSGFQKSADLERSFKSDIRIISSAVRSGLLTRPQVRAARAGIRCRKHLIAEHANTPVLRLRRRAKGAALGLRHGVGRALRAVRRRVLP